MKKILSFMLIILMICSLVLAHSGRTDGNGGHYNRSTGEYHYHHGHPAHDHENGICPYSYNNSNSPNSVSTKSNSDVNYLGCFALGIATWICGAFVGIFFKERKTSKNKSPFEKIDNIKKYKFFKLLFNFVEYIFVLTIPFLFYFAIVIPFYSFVAYELFKNGEFIEPCITIILSIIIIAIYTYNKK